VEINPTYRQAWLQLSHLYVQTGRKVEAINALRRTIDTGGDWPDVHHLLGELYRGRQRKAAARKCYQRALTLNPDYHPAAEGLEQLAA
jgi:tetratricopeptide (TPR) repeat protein